MDTNIHGPSIHDDDHLCEYLTHCPLLADIKSWSHWNRLYMQEKGHIKEFLHRNKSKLPNMLWLELSNDNTELICLSKNPNVRTFETELMKMHLEKAAAHLLSLAVQEKDCPRLPIARLQTVMKQWFQQLKTLNKNQSSQNESIGQILKLLSFLPFPFSSCLVQQLILEPAEHVFPNCKSMIWKLAKNSLRIKLHLEDLGLTLGIDEWTQDLYKKAMYPSDNLWDDSESNEITTTINTYGEQSKIIVIYMLNLLR